MTTEEAVADFEAFAADQLAEFDAACAEGQARLARAVKYAALPRYLQAAFFLVPVPGLDCLQTTALSRRLAVPA